MSRRNRKGKKHSKQSEKSTVEQSAESKESSKKKVEQATELEPTLLLDGKPKAGVMIWYTEVLPLDPQHMKLIPVSELEKKGLKLDESVWRHGSLAKTPEDFKFPEKNLETLENEATEKLKDPYADLVVVWMGEDLGFGVFTRVDRQKDEFIALFTGILGPSGLESISKDSVSYPSNFQYAYYPHGPNGRGIASLFQHLPCLPKIRLPDEKVDKEVNKTLEEELQKNYQEAGSNKPLDEIKCSIDHQCVAFLDKKPESQNLRFFCFLIGKIPAIGFKANRKIPAGSQLGFAYQNYLIGNRIQARYFDLKGQVIPSEKYRRVRGYLFFDNNRKYVGDFSPLVNILRQNPQMAVITIDSSYGKFLVTNEELRQSLVQANTISANFGIKKEEKNVSQVSLFPQPYVVSFANYDEEEFFSLNLDNFLKLRRLVNETQNKKESFYSKGLIGDLVIHCIDFKWLSNLNDARSERISEVANLCGVDPIEFREKFKLSTPNTISSVPTISSSS